MARGGNEPATGGVAGTDAAGRGGTSIGRGGTSAGQGGTSAGQGNTGGTGGGPDDDCSCDEPGGIFSCTVPIESFCFGPSSFGCPPTLDKVRMLLDAVCKLDGGVGRYSECAGSTVQVSWLEGWENEYGLVFDVATGKLVGGAAIGYVGGSACEIPGSIRAGISPSSCVPACRFCREFDEGIGGEGGGPGLPLCEFPP